MKELLSAKIHRATITKADVNYEGSISISKEYLKQSGIKEYEKVLIADVSNGARFETYVIISEEPKTFCVNGAAALLVTPGDKIIIMAFEYVEEHQIPNHKPKIVFLDDNNNIVN